MRSRSHIVHVAVIVCVIPVRGVPERRENPPQYCLGWSQNMGEICLVGETETGLRNSRALTMVKKIPPEARIIIHVEDMWST